MVEPVIKKPSAAKIWETNNVELDSSFSENPCAMRVYEKLMDNAVFYNLLQGFNANTELMLEWKIDSLKDGFYTGIALTDASGLANGDGKVLITIDPSVLGSSSELALATIMLHEVIHAELFRVAILEEGYTASVLDSLDWYGVFLELAEANALNQGDIDMDPNNPSGHHILMATHYRQVIKDALYLFDGISYGEDADKDSLVESLTWGGLIWDLPDYNLVGTHDGTLLTPDEYKTLEKVIYGDFYNAVYDDAQVRWAENGGEPCVD